jgi:TctA family transporter
MLDKLKKRGKVSGIQLFLILCVFAITGSLTAYLSRQITSWLDIEKYSFLFWTLKLIVLIFGYQVIILLVSIPFGQFSFFWNYEKKILKRMGILKK